MKKTIPIIIIFYFIQAIIHNLGHPVTPAFVRSLEISDYMFGVFFAAMSLGLMIGGPIFGSLGDQGKKKSYIMVGLLFYSIGQFLFGYIHHPVWMVVFRFLSGIGVASAVTLFTSHVVETASLDKRAKYLAYIGAAFTLGASLGYWVGGFLSTNPFIQQLLGTDELKRVFLIQAIANGLYVLFIGLVYKEEKGSMQIHKKASMLAGWKNITKMEPKLLLFLGSLTFITMGSVNLSKYIDVYFDELGYNPQQLGTFVMVTGFASLFASIALVPMVARAKKQIHTMILLQIGSAAIVLYAFRANQFLVAMYTIFLIYVFFRTIYQPLEQNYISLFAKAGSYGSTIGLRQSFVSIGMIVGPLIGGFLYERNSQYVFDASAIFFLVGVGLLVLVSMTKSKEELA